MSTLKIMQSKVNKDTTIEPIIISSNTGAAHSASVTASLPNSVQFLNMNDVDIMNELINLIYSLDKDAHQELYIALRKIRTRQFFAISFNETKFNIYALNNTERADLYTLVKLCKDNMTRRHILEKAENEHNETMNNLDKKLGGGAGTAPCPQ